MSASIQGGRHSYDGHRASRQLNPRCYTDDPSHTHLPRRRRCRPPTHPSRRTAGLHTPGGRGAGARAQRQMIYMDVPMRPARQL